MKKFQRISVITTIFFFLNLFLVHAATFDPVTKKLKYIFFNMSGSASFAVWLKFAFFMIIFAVMYGAGMRVKQLSEGSMKRALGVISFIIALTTAIFVPYKLMLYIFKLYHAILVVLFGILPALIGYLVAQRIPVEETGADGKPKRWGRVIRGFIYILITIFIFGLIGQIQADSSPETKIYMQILEPLVWGAIIAFILGIFNLLMAMGGDTVANAALERLGIKQPATGTTAQQAKQEPEDIQKVVTLRGEINAFIRKQVGGAGSLQEYMSRLYDQFKTNIESQPQSPQKKADAQQYLIEIQNARIIERNRIQRERMNKILSNPQYNYVPEQERIQFEQVAALYVQLQTTFTAIYRELLRAA